MGCCVFAYLSWRSVGREVLDTSGKVTSCTGCCGLATSSPRMSPSHHFMPVMHWGGCGWFLVCGALRDVQRAEHCSARGGTWRCASKGSALTLLCHIPLVSHTSHPLAHTFRYSPKTRRDLPRPHQDEGWKCWSSAVHSSPSLCSLSDTAFACRCIFPCHCLPVPVLWLLSYHFTCTFPSQERINMV